MTHFLCQFEKSPSLYREKSENHKVQLDTNDSQRNDAGNSTTNVVGPGILGTCKASHRLAPCIFHVNKQLAHIRTCKLLFVCVVGKEFDLKSSVAWTYLEMRETLVSVSGCDVHACTKIKDFLDLFMIDINIFGNHRN